MTRWNMPVWRDVGFLSDEGEGVWSCEKAPDNVADEDGSKREDSDELRAITGQAPIKLGGGREPTRGRRMLSCSRLESQLSTP